MRTTIAVLLLFSSLPLAGQPASPLAEAQQKLAAGDADGAIAILTPFLEANPRMIFAYNTLGAAHQQKGEYAKAIENYEKAAQAPALRGQAWFNIATVHAEQKNVDESLRWLAKVRSTGSFDFDLFRSDARLAEVRKSPRFEGLIPAKRDFGNPFVEPVRVIHEWTGETKGSQFGWIARRVGDVDRDGVADFVTSAPTFPADGGPAGKIYVYSSKSGKLLWSAVGEPGHQLGLGIEGAGDVDRDGVPDVIAGAPGAGRSYVYSGRDGRVIHTLGEGNAAEQHGRHVSGVGDVNGDGHADVVAGAPGVGTGRVYVYSGKDATLLRAIDGEADGDQFGVAVAGDDGIIIVGAPAAGPSNTGRVYVYDKLAAEPKFVLDADDTGGAFGGMFLSVVGDIDADGSRDIYASDWANSAKGRSTGRIYVHSGKDGRQLLQLTGDASGDGFGIGVADAGDVNRDGHDDLVVGAWQESSAAISGGKVYVYSGKDRSLLRTITGRLPGETLGFDTTNVGDVDGDGTPDFLLTSAWSGVNGFQSGRVYIVSGAVKSEPPPKVVPRKMRVKR